MGIETTESSNSLENDLLKAVKWFWQPPLGVDVDKSWKNGNPSGPVDAKNQPNNKKTKNVVVDKKSVVKKITVKNWFDGALKNLRDLELWYTADITLKGLTPAQIDYTLKKVIENPKAKDYLQSLTIEWASEMPSSIKKLTNLKYLSLPNWNIKEIPNWFFSVLWKETHLKSLDLSGNKSDNLKLPKDLGDLEDLLSLNLKDTKISSIPAEISKCKKLNDLNIQDTWIEKLPKEICYLNPLNIKAYYSDKIFNLVEGLQHIPFNDPENNWIDKRIKFLENYVSGQLGVTV